MKREKTYAEAYEREKAFRLVLVRMQLVPLLVGAVDELVDLHNMRMSGRLDEQSRLPVPARPRHAPWT